MRWLLFTSLLFLGSIASAQDVPWTDPAVPVPVVYEGTVKVESDDPALKDLVWHRWTAGRFTVLALNDQQGKYLAQNANSIKNWILTRWGLPDTPLSAECRLLCVYNVELMNKLFRLNQSRVEVRKDNGSPSIYVGWLLTDGAPEQTLAVPLTQVCLSEIDSRYQLGLGFWAKRGLGKLNMPVAAIRQEIMALTQHLQSQKSVYFSKTILNMDQASYDKLSAEDKTLFDRQCMVLCLLLRKEFGQAKLHTFMNAKSVNPEQLLQRVYLFRDYGQFDVSLMRYMGDLCSDVAQNKTPDSYLNITPVKGRNN
jgi:hypothetical protein